MIALQFGNKIINEKSEESASLLEKLSDDKLKNIIKNYKENEKKYYPGFIGSIGAPLDSEFYRACGAEVALKRRYGEDYILREVYGERKPATSMERLYSTITGKMIKIKGVRNKMKYKVYYKVWEAKGYGLRIEESSIFEYPKILCVGDKIQLDSWSKRVSEIWHRDDAVWLYVKEPTSHAKGLEQKLNEAKQAFSKLKEVK